MKQEKQAYALIKHEDFKRFALKGHKFVWRESAWKTGLNLVKTASGKIRAYDEDVFFLYNIGEIDQSDICQPEEKIGKRYKIKSHDIRPN